MSKNHCFAPQSHRTVPVFLSLFTLREDCLATLGLSFDLFSPPQAKWIAGVAVLSLLLILCVVFLCRYLRCFLVSEKRCGALESDLAKNRRELCGTKDLLTEKTRQHQDKLDEAGAAMFELSESGDCIYANAAMSALLGAQEGRLLGDGLVEFVHPDDRKRVRQEWAGFAAREAPLESSFRFQRADGEVVHVTERGGLLLNAGKKISGYFGQVMDLTPIRQSEQQLRGDCEHLGEQLRDCEQKLTATSSAYVEAVRKKDALADELKQTETAMLSREAQFEKALAERDKREKDFNGVIRNLEAQKAEAEEALEVRRKELEESAARYDALTSKLEAIEKEFVARKKQFEEIRDEHEKREEEQNRIIQELETQKAKADDILDVHRRQFEEEAQNRKKLETELRKTRDVFGSEKELFESNAGARIAELEENSAEQATRLAQLTRARAELERELRETRKEVEAGRKHVELQVKQGTVLQRKELKKLQANKQKLETALEKSNSRVNELEKTLCEYRQELKQVVGTRKAEQQELLKARQELRTQLQQEKLKLSKLQRQIEEAQAEKQTAEARWKKQHGELASKSCELEERLRERTHELTFAMAARREDEQAFRRERRELQELIEQEKENLTQRIRLFKEETAETRKNQEKRMKHEAELMETISDLEKQLDRKVQDLTYAAGERKNMERNIERLKTAAAEGLHRMLHLTEDLTGPLAPVVELSGETLQEENLSPELSARLEEINRGAKRLLTILSYRRELILLEDGTVCAEPEWFELNGFLTELTDEFNAQAETERLFFAFSRKGNFSGECRADHAKIRQVLGAVYTRALSKTSRGQVGFHAVCDPRGEGRSEISFSLIYSGLDQDAALINALSETGESDKPCSELSGEEIELDLLRRQAQLPGGTLKIENPSGRKPLLQFCLPVEQNPAGEPDVQDRPAAFHKQAV